MGGECRDKGKPFVGGEPLFAFSSCFCVIPLCGLVLFGVLFFVLFLGALCRSPEKTRGQGPPCVPWRTEAQSQMVHPRLVSHSRE
jgi:hypothetical protein